MDSLISRPRAGYTMVPKDDTAIDTSVPYGDSNEEDDSRRERELGENPLKGRTVLNRDKSGRSYP